MRRTQIREIRRRMQAVHAAYLIKRIAAYRRALLAGTSHTAVAFPAWVN